VASSNISSGKSYRFYPRNYLEAQPGMFLIWKTSKYSLTIFLTSSSLKNHYQKM
jgi:hypothetical protein